MDVLVGLLLPVLIAVVFVVLVGVLVGWLVWLMFGVSEKVIKRGIVRRGSFDGAERLKFDVNVIPMTWHNKRTLTNAYLDELGRLTAGANVNKFVFMEKDVGFTVSAEILKRLLPKRARLPVVMLPEEAAMVAEFDGKIVATGGELIKGDSVAIITEAATIAAPMVEVAKALRRLGVNVHYILALIDYEDGARDQWRVEGGLELRAYAPISKFQD